MKQLIIFAVWTTIHTLFCISWAFCQDEPVSVETIEQIKSAVVPVVCITPISKDEYKVIETIGSGFFVNNEGYFLTAGHVLDDWDKIDQTKGKCRPAIYVPIGGWKALNNKPQFFIWNDCVRSEHADIAVCHSTPNPFLDKFAKEHINYVTFGSFNDFKDGTPIAFTGFPLSSVKPLTSKGNIASNLDTNKRIVIDKSAWPGASGSPVYLSNGKIIGIIIQMGINQASGLAYARPTEFITFFLAMNKVRYTE